MLTSSSNLSALVWAWLKDLAEAPSGTVVVIDASLSGIASQVSESVEEQECRRKREVTDIPRLCLLPLYRRRSDQCGGTGTKACRERMRREKFNERFSELSAILEPGRPMKTDKSAILVDAGRVLNQLKTESQEYKATNEKLLEEIKTLKAEKNELREEKLALKADKERIEQQLKMLGLPPTGFMYPPAGTNKMPMFPSYGYVPMWQYLPPSACDTSQDHHLRPPVA
ncbi:hypothetical protein OROGR_015695 [Orobanche gracilis]